VRLPRGQNAGATTGKSREESVADRRRPADVLHAQKIGTYYYGWRPAPGPVEQFGIEQCAWLTVTPSDRRVDPCRRRCADVNPMEKGEARVLFIAEEPAVCLRQSAGIEWGTGKGKHW